MEQASGVGLRARPLGKSGYLARRAFLWGVVLLLPLLAAAGCVAAGCVAAIVDVVACSRKDEAGGRGEAGN
eukprot:1980527-Alexandrium_andersonii.AAC.1